MGSNAPYVRFLHPHTEKVQPTDARPLPTIIQLANKASSICHRQGWKRDWRHGGVHLHLEVSEFIEALRGKGGELPEQEAADVLFVLLSMLQGNNIDPNRVLRILDAKCAEILSGERTFQ